MQDEPPLADELVSPLLHLLQQLRAEGGDLDLHIIMLAIADRTVAHPQFRSMSSDERLSADGRPFPTRGVNVRSIAESTGIPRETVRRKVGALIEAGWVSQGELGLSFMPEAYRVLTPGRQEIERLALKFHDIVAQRRAREA